MKLEFELGKSEKTSLVIERNSFTGKFVYFENGVESVIESPSDIATQLNFGFKKTHKFEVGNKEKHAIEITHSRSVLFGALRPQTYEIKVNGSLFKKHKGY